MTNQEKELFQAVPCNEFNTYWIPCTWFVFRIQEAAKKKKLLNEYAIETIMRVRKVDIVCISCWFLYKIKYIYLAYALQVLFPITLYIYRNFVSSDPGVVFYGVMTGFQFRWFILR